jgi:hypothetical protein
MLGVETGVMGAQKPSWGSKDAAGLKRCCWGLETRSWGLKSVAGWSKRVVEGLWVVETRAGRLKDKAGGSKTHCWWSRHVAGVENAW